MAKSTFTGSLAGALGSVLKLLLVRKSGATEELGTTKAGAGGRFSFELDSSEASAALNGVRSGDASLQLQAEIEGQSLRIELPKPATSRGRAAVRALDFGALSAPAVTRAGVVSAVRPAVTPKPIGTGLGGVLGGGLGGTIQPLDANQMLLDLRNRDTQITQLRTDLGVRDTQITQLRTDLGTRDTQINQLRLKIATDEPELLSLRSQISSLTTARDQAVNERLSLAKQLNASTSALTEAQNSVKTIQARIDALSVDFAKSKTDLAASAARVRVLEEELNAPGRPVPLNSVIEGLGGQVAASANNIKQLGGWNLSDVRLQLKMMVTDGGSKVHFPKPGETPAGGEVSAVDFVLRPTQTTTSTSQDLAVPSVVGYSPLVAERKLRALGLSVTTSYQTVKEVAGAPKKAGRVMTQRPAAGGRIAAAGTVELLIGKT